MQKVNIKLENCYGIKKLSHSFCFDDKNAKTCIIYSSNGTMKTSFSKSLKNISEGNTPKDEIFTDRISTYQITDENGIDIAKESIFVVDSYDEGFQTDKVSTLLVNQELREKYDEIHGSINNAKKILMESLKKLSGVTNVEEELLTLFESNDILAILNDLELDIQSELESIELLEALPVYKEIFNPKAIEFVSDSENAKTMEDYMRLYNELLEKSSILKKGVFNHLNADSIGKTLNTNGFFKANHKVILNGDIPISNFKELESLLKEEKEKVMNNEGLKKLFNEMDKKLNKNKDMKEFRELIGKNPDVIEKYKDIQDFKLNVWVFLLQKEAQNYNFLINLYRDAQEKVKPIIDKAQSESTLWMKVLDIYKNRFTVPFEFKLNNQTDVLLNNKAPSIDIIYSDRRERKGVERTELLKVLSLGEKRAFYLLNIIFEIEARKLEKKPVLLIIDDIADSFDYKNKYAIIEYLKEIDDTEIFKIVVMTHNFDFYRTVSGRLNINRNLRFMTMKSEHEIQLVQGDYLQNVFKSWKDRIHKSDRFLVAVIPFARNLAAFSDDNKEYLKLTSLVHYKRDTTSYTVQELEEMFNFIWRSNRTLQGKNRKVYDVIFEVADEIINETQEHVNLENKVVLSIAIRMMAEKQIVDAIDGGEELEGILKSSFPTVNLINLYKNKFSTEEARIATYERVNLMTPENIHLNSFMFEPLLDISDDYLKKLYRDISEYQ